jgi:hypothetical protein
MNCKRSLDVVICCVGLISPAIAGPYAQLAQQTQANSGLLQIVATGGLESQSAAALDATAVRACHTVALEGVTVTSVQIVTQSGQLIRLVTGSSLVGC